MYGCVSTRPQKLPISSFAKNPCSRSCFSASYCSSKRRCSRSHGFFAVISISANAAFTCSGSISRPSGSTSDAPAGSSPPAHDPKKHPPTPPTPSMQEAAILHSPSSHTPAAAHPSQHLSAPHVPAKSTETLRKISQYCFSPLSSPSFFIWIKPLSKKTSLRFS